jgi:hypothetical protein
LVNTINRVTISLQATINDGPRAFSSIYSLTPEQGARLMDYLQGTYGVDEDTGLARTPTQMVDAMSDTMWERLRGNILAYLRGKAAANEPSIAFSRS